MNPSKMKRCPLPTIPVTLAMTLLVAGCRAPTSGYLPASTISDHGLARDSDAAQSLQGQVVRLSGFVDHGNLYGDEQAREILGPWWSGSGPRPGTWRFNLKARVADRTGESFAVHVVDDGGRDRLLRRFAADAAAGRPTPILVTGRLHTFPAPSNLASHTGLYLDVASSADLRLP